MKTKNMNNIDDDMLPEYDFSIGERGKYAKAKANANGYIKIDPIVMEFFKEPEKINQLLISIVKSLQTIPA